MPSIALMRAGNALYENGGAMKMNAVMRTPASMTASIHPIEKASSISRCPSSAAEQGGQLVEQLLGEGDDLGDHPVPADPQGECDGDRLRHEGERHLLYLGDRLEQGDTEADQQCGDQDGSGKLSS